jgi:hypothetical protein
MEERERERERETTSGANIVITNHIYFPLKTSKMRIVTTLYIANNNI